MASSLKFAEWIGQRLPDWTLESAKPLVPFLAKAVESLSPDQERLLLDMFRDMSIDFVRWAARAIMGWSFEGDLDCPVHHIHGAEDRVLPVGQVGPDCVVEGAGHMLNVTHADAVNRFLLEHIENR